MIMMQLQYAKRLLVQRIDKCLVEVLSTQYSTDSETENIAHSTTVPTYARQHSGIMKIADSISSESKRELAHAALLALLE